MGKVRAVIGIFLITLILTLIGCGGGNGSVSLRAKAPGLGGKAGLLGDLPAPSTLREAKVITSGVFRHAIQYDDTLPKQLVTPDVYALWFSPASPDSKIAGAAYAIYAFNTAGYSTDDTLHLAWDSPGTDYADLWIGLANFASDRWDWFPGPSSGALPYDALKYTSTNRVYAVVLCLGSDLWKLRSIRISADVPPVVLSVDPASCTTGSPVTFSAAVDGTVASYAWDFDGGATPDTSSASAPTVTSLAAGTYHPSLTVTNTYGSDFYQFILTVNPSDIPPIAVLGADPVTGDAPITVSFDASDSYDPDDGSTPGVGIDLYEFDYTDDGTYDYTSMNPTAVHKYSTPGTYTCRVRVTDNESDTGTDTVDITVETPITHLVSGTVTMADAGVLAGVLLQLSPGGANDLTDVLGVFGIDVVNNDYVLTPSMTGWTFSPATLPVTVNGGDVPGNNFTAYSLPVANLAGTPLLGNKPLIVDFDASASNDPDNGGLAGAGIAKYEWDWDNDGTYDFDSDTDATVSHTYSTEGAYICCMRATDNEGATATDTLPITVGDGTGFIAAGYVKTEYGVALSGVTMSFSGGLMPVTTDATGFWYRDGISNGIYTVTPSKLLYTFAPENRNFTISGAHLFLSDFIGTFALDPDELYAVPLKATAAVGEPVTILVATGQPAHALQFLSSVGFTIENAGTYVPNSFNIGIPGGARTDTDGYWALMGPPPPPNGSYQDFGDMWMPGSPVDIGGGLHRYSFAIVTMGSYAAPVSIGDGAILFNFELTFSTPGTYHLGFQDNSVFDVTYYSDQNSVTYYWSALDNSYTITVS
jgi:PKD repeat protein